MKRRGRYTNEFKQEVLRMAETSDKPIAELERDLGLSPGLIRKWQQRYRLREDSQQLQVSEERLVSQSMVDFAHRYLGQCIGASVGGCASSKLSGSGW